MSASTTLALATHTHGIGGLFPGLDLSTTQAQQAVLAGLVAGGIMAEADDGLWYDGFWWGAGSVVAGVVAGAGIAALAQHAGGRGRGR